VRADLSQLSGARVWLGDIARAASLPESRVFDLQVASSEAIANGIEHAQSEVEILVWAMPDRLLVEVMSNGVFRPGLFKDNDQRRRGLGLPLMASLADQMHVSRPPDGRTKVSLTFLRERPGESSGDAVTPAS
jgi:anti-sigma regulatory factor (Ser/Thr protein kinase)